MRIRSVKPDFWRDERLALLPDTARLFYIGIWQEADDAGWLRWDVPEIALDLYGYQSRGRRERWVTERGLALSEAGRLIIHGCGHAFVPKLTKHQKFGGRPVYTVRDAHARDCAPLPQIAPHGREGKGRGGESEVRGGVGGNGSTSQDEQLRLARESLAKHHSGEQPLTAAGLKAFEHLIEKYGPP